MIVMLMPAKPTNLKRKSTVLTGAIKKEEKQG